MKIQFIGAGSAFNKDEGQSNALVIADSGKKLLIDCGSYCWQFADKIGVGVGDVDAVYISHLHADHVGGLEEFAFCTYFNPNLERPKMYCNSQLMHDLWDQALRGGLESIQGKVVTLTEYFDCHPVANNDKFIWEDIVFIPVQTVHVMAGYYVKYSYGLLIQDLLAKVVEHEEYEDGTESEGLEESPIVFFTTDTQFCPNQISDFYKRADIIFQDCETVPFKSGVHAHYEELKTLSDDVRSKMYLYHYQPNAPQNPVEDGFKGFVSKGQEFKIS